MLRFTSIVLSALISSSRLSLQQLRLSQFSTEQRSPVLTQSLSSSMLLQLMSARMLLSSSAAVMVWVPRIQLLSAFSQFIRNSRRISLRKDSPSVSMMTLRSSLSIAPSPSKLQARALFRLDSGVSAQTVQLVLTRTPSRSSVTTQTSTLRLTSLMTPRSPVVSQSLT